MTRSLIFKSLLAGFFLLASIACSNGNALMPDVIGMSQDEATEALENAGLEDWTVHWMEGSKPLKVISQSPQAGEVVNDDSEVQINLSGRYGSSPP